MSVENIIQELKKEHEEILVMFEYIDNGKEFSKKKEKIKELRDFISNHLEKEDKYIYLVFKQSRDKELVNLGDLFSGVMNEYATEFLDVVDRILNQENEVNEGDWKDYEEIRNKIKDRVTVEETILFPAFENRNK